MEAYKEQAVFVITTTPKSLRRMADNMENSFGRKVVGDSTCTDIIYGDGFIIKICGDQEEYNRHKSTNKDKWI